MCPKDAQAKCLELDWALIKVLVLSDNYRSIKANLYNIEVTTEGQCRSKRVTFILKAKLGYEYETTRFHHSLFRKKSELLP